MYLLMNKHQYKVGDVMKMRCPHFHERKLINITIEDVKIVKLAHEFIHVRSLVSKKDYTMDYTTFGIGCNTSIF